MSVLTEVDYFIVKFDQCIFLLLVKIAKLTTRTKEFENEVSTDLSTEEAAWPRG